MARFGPTGAGKRGPSARTRKIRILGSRNRHARGRQLIRVRKPKNGGSSSSALAGDANALSPIFAHHSSKLFRAAFSLLRNKEDAEDALQEGLANAYIHLNSFQRRSLFSTWLTRIVMNAALMTLRRKRARPETSLDECQGGESDDWPAWGVDRPSEPRASLRRDGSKANRRKPYQATFIGPAFGIPAPRNGGPLDEGSAGSTRYIGERR